MNDDCSSFSDDIEVWGRFRGEMPIARQWAYFDHAAVAPISGPAQAALIQWAREAAGGGDVHWSRWSRRVSELRALAAGMLGAETEEIALVGNTTEGVNLVAEGFPWEPGDNVVTLEDEFPTNQYPWLNLADRGVETRRVAAGPGDPIDRLVAACNRRTRIVTVSWVGFLTGRRIDVDRLVRLVHDRGALVFLDAIQGLGVLPLDVRRTPVDFLAADGHKWMLGPEGAGLFYLRREHLERLRPLGVGWNSVVHAHDFSRIECHWKPSAARYEGGSQNMAGMIALAASLELLSRFGPEAIGRRIAELTDLACRRLLAEGAVLRSPREPAAKSGIVSFELPGRDAEEVRRRCLQSRVVLSCRGGRLRISPHAYNTAEDVDRLIAALGER